jgi:hypothetical protein
MRDTRAHGFGNCAHRQALHLRQNMLKSAADRLNALIEKQG